jgi:hypothetical protein
MAAGCALCTHVVLTLLNDSLKRGRQKTLSQKLPRTRQCLAGFLPVDRRTSNAEVEGSSPSLTANQSASYRSIPGCALMLRVACGTAAQTSMGRLTGLPTNLSQTMRNPVGMNGFDGRRHFRRPELVHLLVTTRLAFHPACAGAKQLNGP